MPEPITSSEAKLEALFRKHPSLPIAAGLILIATVGLVLFLGYLGICRGRAWLEENLAPPSVSAIRIATEVAEDEGYLVLDAQYVEDTSWRAWGDFEVLVEARDSTGRARRLRVACRKKESDPALKEDRCHVWPNP